MADCLNPEITVKFQITVKCQITVKFQITVECPHDHASVVDPLTSHRLKEREREERERGRESAREREGGGEERERERERKRRERWRGSKRGGGGRERQRERGGGGVRRAEGGGEAGLEEERKPSPFLWCLVSERPPATLKVYADFLFVLTADKVVAGHAFQPAVGRRGEGLSHRRSQSMTDHPVAALPAYLRSPLCHRPPPASNAQAVSSESSSGFYNVSRATAAAEAASRQRPHSSLGHPAISSSNNTQASSSSAGRTVQSPGQRPHSSMGFPLRSFLSRSQTSLPLAIESEAFPASALSTNQRLQSSAYPASPTLGQRPQGSGSVQGLPSASHRTSQRPHSSMDHPVPSSWGGLSQGLMPSFVHASSHQPTSSPTDQKPPLPNHLHVESASASALRDYQTNGKLSSPFMPSSSTPSSRIPLPSQQLPPQPAGPAPAFQPPVPPKPSLPSPTFPPSYNSSHQQSSAHHMYPATEPQDSSGSVQSINHTGTVMNNHSAFSQGKAQHSDMPTRLSSSLNQSQDGRRKVLMHQHSVPEFPNQHNWVGTTNSHTPPPTGPSSHGRHGPTSEARSRTFNPGISHPMLGEIGRSKSSTQIISTAPQLPSNVTELMTLHSFCSKGADDISVSSGEVVYSDLSKQSERDWLWVYSPRLARHGYIPRDNVRIPRSAGGDLRSENVARVWNIVLLTAQLKWNLWGKWLSLWFIMEMSVFIEWKTFWVNDLWGIMSLLNTMVTLHVNAWYQV